MGNWKENSRKFQRNFRKFQNFPDYQKIDNHLSLNLSQQFWSVLYKTRMAELEMILIRFSTRQAALIERRHFPETVCKKVR